MKSPKLRQIHDLSDHELTIIHSMLYILSKFGGEADLWKLFKIQYLADKIHILKWGCSMTDDHYAALEHGPVPSTAYDLINALEDKGFMRAKKELMSRFFSKHGHFVKSNVDFDPDELSGSMIEAIDETILKYGNLPSGKIRDLSHDNAYHSIWKDGKGKGKEISEIVIAEQEGAEEPMINYIKLVLENKQVFSG